MAFGYFPPKKATTFLIRPIGEFARWVLGQDNLLKRAHVREAFRHMELEPEDHVLEVGAGGLFYAGEIARQVRSVVAMDQSETVGQPLKHLRFPPRLIVVRADAHALPFADARFDKVFISEVFPVLADPLACAREVFRVLKPGGKVISVHGDIFRGMQSVFEWRVSQVLIRRAQARWGTPTTYAEFQEHYLALHGTKAAFFEDRDRFVDDLLTRSGFVDLTFSWAVRRRSQLLYCFLLLLRMYHTGRPVLGRGQVLFLPLLKCFEVLDWEEAGGLTLFCSARKPLLEIPVPSDLERSHAGHESHLCRSR